MENRYEKFTSLIVGINRSIQKIKNQEMQEFGLKGNQVQCIYYLSQSLNGLTPFEVCQLCEEDKAAISRTIKNLEEKGLVFIDQTQGKKYRNLIKLTEQGLILGEQIQNIIKQKLEIASKGIQEIDRKKLYEMLEIINKNLEKLSKGEDI